MVIEDKKHTAHRAVVTRVLEGDGRASRAARRAAFENAGFGETLRTLIDKIARQPTRVTDEDIAPVLASGESENQIFELVVCAAIGAATRQYESALHALEEALIGTKGSEHAPEHPQSGYTFGTKVLFAFIHLVSRQPLPDAARLVSLT